MTDSTILLPQGFDALQPFADRWAAERAEDRHRARLSSTAPEREAFVLAVKGVVPAALEYLDGRDMAGFDAAEQRLMDLLLTFAHVAPAVEQQGAFEAQHAIGAGRLTITRTPADIRR